MCVFYCQVSLSLPPLIQCFTKRIFWSVCFWPFLFLFFERDRILAGVWFCCEYLNVLLQGFCRVNQNILGLWYKRIEFISVSSVYPWYKFAWFLKILQNLTTEWSVSKYQDHYPPSYGVNLCVKLWDLCTYILCRKCCMVWKKKDKKDYAMTFIIFSFQETAFTVLLRVYLMWYITLFAGLRIQM